MYVHVICKSWCFGPNLGAFFNTTSSYALFVRNTKRWTAELMAIRVPMICAWLRNDLRCHDSPEP